MIKIQRLVPFFLNNLRRPYLPLTFINTLPSNSSSIKALEFYPFASFGTENNSKANKSIDEEEEFTSDDEGGEGNVEGWGTRVEAYYLREKSRYNLLFGKVLTRVTKTTLLYAGFTPEEKAKLTEDSRFYYVQKKFDELGEAQTEEFVNYLKSIPDLLIKRSREKAKIFGIETETDSQELRMFTGREQYKKRFIAHYMRSDPKNAKILGDMAREFLETENADYKSFLRLRDEEKKIGKFQSHIRGQSQRLRTIVDYKEDFKRKFEKLLNETEKIASHKIFNERKKYEKKEIQDKKVKASYYSVSNLVRVGFVRMTLTIGLYLTFPQRVLENIPKGSRFYYVHKRLDSWSTEDKHKLWIFLDKIKNNVNYGFPEEVVKNKEMKSLSSANQDEIFYLLHNKDYGKLLQECFTEFFEEDNMDKFYFLSPNEDEFTVGKFAPSSRRMNKFTKEYYGSHLGEIREKFQDYLDAKSPQDLVKPKEVKETNKAKKVKKEKGEKEETDDNKEKLKSKRGRKPKNTFGNISI